MRRNNILFLGEDNKTNHELYQLLNWRFNVNRETEYSRNTYEKLAAHNPVVILISLVGSEVNYRNYFSHLSEERPECPVIILGSVQECEAYKDFFALPQFHKLQRPILGKKVLEACFNVIDGKECEDSGRDDFEKNRGPREKLHVLVVDDNAMLLRNIKSILEKKYSVAVAPSGFHAFVSMGKKKPDLILLDYEMPEINGKAVLEKLQAEEEFAEIPVVFLTAADTKEIVYELLSLRPAGYILKPVEPKYLYEKLEEILGR